MHMCMHEPGILHRADLFWATLLLVFDWRRKEVACLFPTIPIILHWDRVLKCEKMGLA